MEDKFTFIHKDNKYFIYTAQISLVDEEKMLVMWIGETGNLCGEIYDKLEVQKYINNEEWIVIEKLNMLEL